MDITSASTGYRLAEVLLEELPDAGVFLLDRDRRIQRWVPAVERILGYTETEFVGSNGNDLFTPQDREQGLHDATFARARLDGRTPELRWHARKDGSRIVVDGVLRVVFDAEGNLVGYLKIVRDIGWHGAGSGFLDTVLNHTPDVIYVRDCQGLCAYANPMTAANTGAQHRGDRRPLVR